MIKTFFAVGVLTMMLLFIYRYTKTTTMEEKLKIIKSFSLTSVAVIISVLLLSFIVILF